MVSAKFLTHITSSLNLTAMDYKSEAEVKKNLSKANKRWKALKLKASTQQVSLMKNLADAWAQMDGSRFSGVHKALRLQEKQRASSAKIWSAHRKTRNGGVIVVVAPNNQGEWE